MKRTIRNAILSVALLTAVAPASASLHLRLSDGTPGGTVVVADQGPDDINPTVGFVTYIGTVGPNWQLSVTTGISKPVLGSAAAPELDLSISFLASVGPGNLSIEMTDTDFTGVGPAVASIFGNTGGQLVWKTYADGANTLFGKTQLITDQGPFAGNNFIQATPGNVTVSAPYSITFEVGIQSPAGGRTDFDALFKVTPSDTCECVLSIVCPQNLTLQCGSDTTTNATGTLAINSTVSCAPVVRYDDVITPGNCPATYVIARTWTVTPVCGDTKTCTQLISVEDTNAPSVRVLADLTVECDAVPLPGDASATDACDPNPSVMYLGEVRVDGDCASRYTLVRSWKATDACGNAATNSQTLTVVDTTKPILTVPGDLTVQCDAVPAPGDATATDNCDLNPLVRYLGAIQIDGLCANSYRLVRSWEAQDACGNAVTKSQTITVVDTIAPVLVVPGNVTVQCDAIPAPGTASALDNCDTNLVVVYVGETRTSGTCANNYLLVRTWSATDACGNATTRSQTITVEDTVPPVLTVPANTVAECSAIPAAGSATAVDNCDSAPVIVYLGQTANGSGCAYTLTRTWKATDACGNSSTASQTITVQDTTPPVIVSVPADTELGCDPAGLPSDATVKGLVTATDNCGTVTINVSHVDGGTACASNRTFTITATDGCTTSPARTVVYTASCAPCVASTFNFNGSSSLDGTDGNVRTFTTNGVSVRVTAFSRTSAGSWASAYLGQYGGGLGVTDSSEGDGSGNAHTVDNIDRVNYVLFEFSQPVVLNRAFLGYVVTDSDLSLWIGSFADPFNNHLTLSDAVLGSFGFTEENLTDSSSTRWADLNAGELVGNAVVISALASDTTPEDNFKIQLLDICKRTCQPLALACVSATTGKVGVPYSASLLASDGLAPYTFSIISGSLPPGLSLNPNTGAITGTPTTAGPFSFTAQVTDSLGATASSGAGGCSITIAPPCTANICGSVLRDCDADGYLTGEQGLAGWTVTLKTTGGSVVATTTTAANGTYCFDNVAAGTYDVVVTPKPNYTPTFGCDSSNKIRVTQAACQNKTGVNFGYTGTAPGVNLVVTGPSSATCGNTITYTFAVTNTGNTCLYGGMRVDAPLLGGQVFHQTPVNPGEGFVFTKTYVVKSSDAPSLNMVATAIGDPPGGLANVTKQVTVTTAVSCQNNTPVPNCLASTPGCNQVYLNWTGTSGATYKVKRSTTKGGPYTTVKSGSSSTSYTDTSLVNGTVYYYVVSAVKNGTESANSDEESAIPSSGLPSPWNTADIGSVGDKGGASYASSKFTVVGSGNDIWNTSDEFRYVYQAAGGNCTVIARVTGVQSTDPWAKAGVMIRESLSANSEHAFVCVTPGNGVAFQSRTSTGASSLNSNTTGLTAPYWVKVVRSGSTLSGYSSPNGSTWTFIGSQTISMSSGVYIGLGVTSHNDGVLCTATFDNVTATP